MPVIHISDLSYLDKSASEFMGLCKNRFFFAFYGDLGVGKTTFIKAVCKALGVSDHVSSPTFSLVNEYQLPVESGKMKRIFHMDFYRLKHAEEALHIGIEDYFRQQDAYCFIEWPERVEPLLPEETVKVRMEKHEDGSRILII